jgi:hypothetical protein
MNVPMKVRATPASAAACTAFDSPLSIRSDDHFFSAAFASTVVYSLTEPGGTVDMPPAMIWVASIEFYCTGRR